MGWRVACTLPGIEAEEEQRRSAESALDRLLRVVTEAMAAGANVKCPHCDRTTVKDGACMHKAGSVVAGRLIALRLQERVFECRHIFAIVIPV